MRCIKSFGICPCCRCRNGSWSRLRFSDCRQKRQNRRLGPLYAGSSQENGNPPEGRKFDLAGHRSHSRFYAAGLVHNGMVSGFHRALSCSASDRGRHVAKKKKRARNREILKNHKGGNLPEAYREIGRQTARLDGITHALAFLLIILMVFKPF